MAISDLVSELKSFDKDKYVFDTIGVWPRLAKLGLLSVLVVLALGGSFWFKIKDMYVERDKVVAKEQGLRKDFEQKAFEAKNLQAYKDQMEEIEKSFGALLAQLPEDTEVPGLLEDITEIGLGSSLNFSSIALQQEKASEFYVELPIKIVARGDYHDFGAFVSGVSSLPRIVTLHDYELKKDAKGGGLSLSILAKTYRYRGDL